MSRNEMLENLEREFKSLDTDGSGTIKLQGLKEALMRYLGTDDEEAERIFKKLDQSGDDEIHYSEFLAACLLTRLAMNESCIQDVFDKLDVDKTGVLTMYHLGQYVSFSIYRWIIYGQSWAIHFAGRASRICYGKLTTNATGK